MRTYLIEAIYLGIPVPLNSDNDAYAWRYHHKDTTKTGELIQERYGLISLNLQYEI